MGFGDEIMGSGMARGAAARGRRVAFGDGRSIKWHTYAHQIYRDNPNVAPPGSEGSDDLEWIAHYPGKRVYNIHFGDRWVWFPQKDNRPGEVFLDSEELKFGAKQGSGFVLIEPNVPTFKSVAFNKQWPVERYQAVADHLGRQNVEVAQFVVPPPHGPGRMLRGVRRIAAPTFRHGLAALAQARLYLGPEGGLHHGAAATGVRAVVLFGGFIPPSATGYRVHVNMAAKDTEACGSLKPCSHCRRAMDSIRVDHVVREVERELCRST